MPSIQPSTEHPENSWLPETAEFDVMASFAHPVDNNHNEGTAPDGSVSVGMASPNTLSELLNMDVNNQAMAQNHLFLQQNSMFDCNGGNLNFDFANFCEPYFEGPSLPMYLSTVVESPNAFCDTGMNDNTSHSWIWTLLILSQRLDQDQPSPTESYQKLPVFQGGFSLEQIDPVEAKCIELRKFLAGSEPLLTEEIISTCVTRENLLLFIKSFGRDYTKNFPILHSPTFTLSTTPLILLIAMFCVGACYCEGVVPPAYVFKIAMRVLMMITHQPHEVNMQGPSLSTIQASCFLCPVLVCSRDEIACNFVTMHFARNFSMAKRAGVFELEEPINYTSLTDETFNWQEWIERESRKRVGCAIFAHDVAGSIFQGSMPSISPLDFDVELPCFESCWEATSASECLKRLKSMPQQLLVSAAMRQLRSMRNHTSSILEVSGFGMFTILKGLHCLVWQVAHYDMEPALELNGSSSTLSLDDQLSHDLSGQLVSSLADVAIATHTSQAIKSVNSALDSWRLIWDARQHREMDHEYATFVLDPLPFWWLAKLYLLLHCAGANIKDSSEFANPRSKGLNTAGKIVAMTKVVGWLQRFRRHPNEATDPTSMNCLKHLMKPVGASPPNI